MSHSHHHIRDIGLILQEVEAELAAVRDHLSMASTKAPNSSNNINNNYNNNDRALLRLDAVLQRAQGDLASKAELVLAASTQQPALLPLAPRAHHHRSDQRSSHRSDRARARARARAPALPRSLPPLDPPLPLALAASDASGPSVRRPRTGHHKPRPPSASRPGPPGKLHPLLRPKTAASSSDSGPAVGVAKLTLHDPEDRRIHRDRYSDSLGFNQYALKLDLESEPGPKYIPPPELKPPTLRTPMDSLLIAEAAARARAEVPGSHQPTSQDSALPSVTPASQADPAAAAEPPDWAAHPSNAAANELRKYAQLMDDYSLHQVLIRNGSILASTPEYASFERSFAHKWGPISSLLARLEDLCARSNVKLAIIDGKAVAAAATSLTAGLDVSDSALVKTIVNAEDIIHLLQVNLPRFTRDDGPDAAASLIQATFRMYRTRAQYLTFRHFLGAVTRIQRVWRSKVTHQRTLRKIEAALVVRDNAFHTLTVEFSVSWPRISAGPVTVIHLPSLFLSPDGRAALNVDMDTAHNAQMARLLDLLHDNVSVIYVAPFDLPDDLRDYYIQMLELRGVHNVTKRLKFVVPEAAANLPRGSSLALALRASPKALRRIRNFVAGRNAYIVPRTVSDDDVWLSVSLGVPLLGVSPSLRARYATKSGGLHLLKAATSLHLAPARSDIYTRDQFDAALTALIAEHIHVSAWLFKTNHGIGGRGHAVFRTSSLACYPMLCAQNAKYGDGWFAPFQQEAVRKRIRSELATVLHDSVEVMAPELYVGDGSCSLWDAYIAAFCNPTSGGIIEAIPDGIVASPSISLLVQPDGSTRVLGAHNQIITGAYAVEGGVFPQSSLSPAELSDIAASLGAAAFELGVLGHVKVDFVVFEPPAAAAAAAAAADAAAAAAEPRHSVWAVDIELGYPDALIPITIAKAMTAGRLSGSTGKFTVRTKGPGSKRVVKSPRTVVWINHLTHPELAAIHYAVLFGVCRELGVAWSPTELAGLVLILKDSWTKGCMGMIAVGTSSADALGILHMAVRKLFVHLSSSDVSAPPSASGNFSKTLTMLKSLVTPS